MSKVTFKQYIFIFVIIIIAFFLILQGIGFSEYANTTLSYQNNRIVPKNTGMIVVLTGGSGRITAAYDLMKEMDVPVLFVAGVHKTVNFDALAKEFKLDASYRDRIKIDNVSRTTLENAKVAQQFAEENDINTIVVVTSLYHIKRAEYVFGKVFEDQGALILPYSTNTKQVEPGEWWHNYNTFSNLFQEFVKYQYYRALLSGK